MIDPVFSIMKPKFSIGQHVKVIDGYPDFIGQTGVVTRIAPAVDVSDRFIYVVRYDVPFRKVKHDMFFEWKLVACDEGNETVISKQSLMEVLDLG